MSYVYLYLNFIKSEKLIQPILNSLNRQAKLEAQLGLSSLNVYLRHRKGTRYQDLTGSDSKNILNFDEYGLEIISGKKYSELCNY